MRGRLGFSVAGGPNIIREGPVLLAPNDQIRLIVRKDDTYWVNRLDPPGADQVEPYPMASAVIDPDLRAVLRDLYLSIDESGALPPQTGWSWALVDLRTWPFHLDWQHAFAKLALEDTTLAVSGEGATGAVLALGSDIGGAVENAAVSRGLRRVGDNEYHIGIHAPMDPSVFAGEPGAPVFEYVTFWQSPPGPGHFGVVRLFFSANGEAPEVPGPAFGPQFATQQLPTDLLRFVFKSGDTLWTNTITTDSRFLPADYVLPVPFGFHAGLAFPLFGNDPGDTTVSIAIVNEAAWIHGEDWAKAFEPDANLLERVWPVELNDQGEAAFEPAVPAALWTGANLKFAVLQKAARNTDADGRLNPWVLRPDARVGDAGDPIQTEPMWALASEENEFEGHPEVIPSNDKNFGEAWTPGSHANLPESLAGRVWTPYEPQPTSARRWKVLVERKITGDPEVGDPPLDDWGAWSDPVYRLANPRPPIAVLCSDGIVEVAVREDGLTEALILRVDVSVIGGSEMWSSSLLPDPRPRVFVEGDQYALLADETREVRNLLNAPQGDIVYSYAVEFERIRVDRGVLFDLVEKRFEITVDVDGEPVNGSSRVFFKYRQQPVEEEVEILPNPNPPRLPRLTSPSAGRLEATWLDPEPVEGADISGYRVQLFNESDNAVGRAAAPLYGLNSALFVAAVQAGRTYRAELLALTEDGRRSVPVETADAVADGVAETNTARPVAPTLRAADRITSGGFRVRFAAAAQPAGVVVTGYEMAITPRAPDGTSKFTSAGTSITARGLAASTRYGYSVVAVAGQNRSPAVRGNATTSAATTDDVVAPPASPDVAAPVDLVVGDWSADGSIQMTVTPAVEKTNAPHTAHELVLTPASGADLKVELADTSETSQTGTITGVLAGTRYTPKARTASGSVWSAYRTEAAFTTTATVENPVAVPVLAGLTAGNARVTVRRGPLDRRAGGKWQIRHAASAASLPSGTVTPGGGAASKIVRGLANGARRWFQIRAGDGAGPTSEWSGAQHATPRTPAAALITPIIRQVSTFDGGLSVFLRQDFDSRGNRWAVQLAPAGSDLDDGVVFYGTSARTPNNGRTGGNGRVIRATGLVNGQEYVLRARAESDEVKFIASPWSAEMRATPTAVVPDITAAASVVADENEVAPPAVGAFRLRLRNPGDVLVEINKASIITSRYPDGANNLAFKVARTAAGLDNAATQSFQNTGRIKQTVGSIYGRTYHVRAWFRQVGYGPGGRGIVSVAGEGRSADAMLLCTRRLASLGFTVTAGDQEVVLTFPTQVGNANAVQYRVYRDNAAPPAWTLLQLTGGATRFGLTGWRGSGSATVGGLANGRTHIAEYRAVALRAAGTVDEGTVRFRPALSMKQTFVPEA